MVSGLRKHPQDLIRIIPAWESEMEFYNFMRSALAWMATIACLYPLNIPCLFYAYRIREGQVRDDDTTRVDNEDLWPRAALIAFLVGLLLVVFIFVDMVLAEWLDLPAGIVHFVAFLCFVPAASFLVAYMFSYDDPFIGLAILALYLCLPIFCLALLNSLIGFWNPVLGLVYLFLKPIK